MPKINIYRKKSVFGSRGPIEVSIDGQPVGALSNGAAQDYEISDGGHQILCSVVGGKFSLSRGKKQINVTGTDTVYYSVAYSPVYMLCLYVIIFGFVFGMRLLQRHYHLPEWVGFTFIIPVFIVLRLFRDYALVIKEV